MKFVVILLTVFAGVLSNSLENEAFQEFLAGNRKFTAALYKEFESDTTNIVYSPLSIEIILALTNEGARGKTHDEIVEGLSLPNTTEKTRAVFKDLLPKLKKLDDDLKLLGANKIYPSDHFKLSDEYSSIAKSIYDSSFETLNFAESKEAAKIINSWVEDNTNHKIKDLVAPESLSADTIMALVNAIYFNGKWLHKFHESQTRKNKFYLTKEDRKDVDIMHQTKLLQYYENPTLNAKFLRLPYKGGDVHMIIVLPNEVDGLAALEKNIDQIFQPQSFNFKKVDVKLPKFVTESTVKLVPFLRKLGIRRAFSSTADFSGFARDGNMYISDVFQKAYINVTESGTEAAAATIVLMGQRSGPSLGPGPLFYFHADHPFLYYITYNDVILFAGRIYNV